MVDRQLFRVLIDYSEADLPMVLWRVEENLQHVRGKNYTAFISEKRQFELGSVHPDSEWTRSDVEAALTRLSSKFEVLDTNLESIIDGTASATIRHKVLQEYTITLRFLKRTTSAHAKSRIYMVDNEHRCACIRECKRVKLFTFEALVNRTELEKWNDDTKRKQVKHNKILDD